MAASPVPNLLHCHASSGCAAVRALALQVRAAAGGRLVLSYVLDADMQRLRIPSVAGARRAHELWTHTCFEAFLRAADATNYCELNFAPSQAWAMCASARTGRTCRLSRTRAHRKSPSPQHGGFGA